jgi:hypothetical protein
MMKMMKMMKMMMEQNHSRENGLNLKIYR